MRGYGGAAAAAAAALVLAACTSGSSSGASTHVSPTPSQAAVAAELPADVRADVTGRLPSRVEWPGAVSVGGGQLYAPGEAAALDTDPVAEAALLRQEGLVAVAAAHVKVPGAQDAVASVFRFTAATGASHMAARMAATRGTTRFAVNGVRGASGWQVVNRDGTVLAANITFTIGRYLYTVGGTPLGPHPLTEAQLEAAAKAWYPRLSTL